ncbi:hypothetical protein, partial [Tannerella forsythia]|uniref:hypothetical protein n=1 Tax=Tannerella forsythia TaxID=28112 RepID=UPI0028E55FDD
IEQQSKQTHKIRFRGKVNKIMQKPMWSEASEKSVRALLPFLEILLPLRFHTDRVIRGDD